MIFCDHLLDTLVYKSCSGKIKIIWILVSPMFQIHIQNPNKKGFEPLRFKASKIVSGFTLLNYLRSLAVISPECKFNSGGIEHQFEQFCVSGEGADSFASGAKCGQFHVICGVYTARKCY